LLDELESHRDEYELLDETERDAIVKSRIGQGLFRARLVEFWGGCAVTGLGNRSLLRASHIKPWRDSSNQERLDPMNGLLLQPTLDHLFDLGLITFDDDAVVEFSKKLSKEDITLLAISGNIRLRKQPPELMRHIRYHRRHVFKRS